MFFGGPHNIVAFQELFCVGRRRRVCSDLAEGRGRLSFDTRPIKACRLSHFASRTEIFIWREFRTQPRNVLLKRKCPPGCTALIHRGPSWPETGANRYVTNEMGGRMSHCASIVQFVRIHTAVLIETCAQTLQCLLGHVHYDPSHNQSTRISVHQLSLTSVLVVLWSVKISHARWSPL